MDSRGYWTLFDRSLTRRRALAATGVAAAAGLLAACGSGGQSASQKEAGKASSLVTERVDTSNQAKRGGIYTTTLASDIATFDPHLLTQILQTPVQMVYSRLTAVKPGIVDQSDGSATGDLAESWEISPDSLTITLKLRQNAGTAPTAPVNGRLIDTQDVLFSYERHKKLGQTRTALWNEASPDAPILSLTSPDKNTIVVKLKEPIGPILQILGDQSIGGFYIIPKEGDGRFDPRNIAIGSGPFYISDYVPSARVVFKRNPNYYNKNVAFVDGVDSPILGEYAANLVQLKAGAVHDYAVRAEDQLLTKQEVPALNLYASPIPGGGGAYTFFGYLPTPADKTPFRDVRVRQAFSMSLDRDLYIETFGSVSKFTSAGIPVETFWNSALLASSFKGWWIDPRSKEFGENGKFYKHDLSEAKRLLTAAGYPNGLEVESHQVVTGDYGVNYPTQVSAYEGMANEAGFKFQKVGHQYTVDWMSQIRDAHGRFTGIAFKTSATEPDPGEKLYSEFGKAGTRWHGGDPDGKGDGSGDPTSEDLLLKIRREFDNDKRKAYAADLQGYLAKMQYYMPSPGLNTALSLAWPALKNYLVFSQGITTRQHYWLDQTLPPFKT
jgi:peptide/nickel transport system substrate-binding protein